MDFSAGPSGLRVTSVGQMGPRSHKEGEDQMRVFPTTTESCASKKTRVGVLLYSLVVGLAPSFAMAQFIKQVDEHGNVTYRDDRSYDYSADEPSLENQRIHAEQIKRLREFLISRDKLPAREPRAPKVTVRTGRSVCLRRPSLTKPTLACR